MSRPSWPLMAALGAAVIVVTGASAGGPPVSSAGPAADLETLPPALLATVPEGDSVLGADTSTVQKGRAGAVVAAASGVGSCVTFGTAVDRSSNTVVQHGERICTAGSRINAYGGCIYRDGFTTVACNFSPLYFAANDASLAIVGHCASGLHSYWANGSVNWTPLGGSPRNYPWSTALTNYISC